MDHLTGIAVAVAEEIVNRKIAENLLGIKRIFQIVLLRECFQRSNQPFLIRFRHNGLSIVENIGVAADFVIGILQLDVAAAHAESALAAFFAAENLGRIKVRKIKAFRIKIRGHIAEVPEIRHIAEVRHFAVPEAGHAAARTPVRLSGFIRAFFGFCFLAVLIHEIAHAEILAVARTAAAEAHAVRLIEVTVIAAVIPLQEGILDRFNGKIQTPVLTVDRNICIAAKRRICAEIAHQRVSEIILHIGIILNEIVQTKLIQSVIALGAVILIELDLEAVAAAVHIAHRAERGIALSADADIFHRFPVDDDCAGRIDFALAGLQEAVPVADHNIKCVNSRAVEQPVFISDCMRSCLNPEHLTVAEQHRQKQCYYSDHNADSVDALMCRHCITPF